MNALTRPVIRTLTRLYRLFAGGYRSSSPRMDVCYLPCVTGYRTPSHQPAVYSRSSPAATVAVAVGCHHRLPRTQRGAVYAACPYVLDS